MCSRDMTADWIYSAEWIRMTTEHVSDHSKHYSIIWVLCFNTSWQGQLTRIIYMYRHVSQLLENDCNFNCFFMTSRPTTFIPLVLTAALPDVPFHTIAFPRKAFRPPAMTKLRCVLTLRLPESMRARLTFNLKSWALRGESLNAPVNTVLPAMVMHEIETLATRFVWSDANGTPATTVASTCRTAFCVGTLRTKIDGNNMLTWT